MMFSFLDNFLDCSQMRHMLKRCICDHNILFVSQKTTRDWKNNISLSSHHQLGVTENSSKLKCYLIILLEPFEPKEQPLKLLDHKLWSVVPFYCYIQRILTSCWYLGRSRFSPVRRLVPAILCFSGILLDTWIKVDRGAVVVEDCIVKEFT